ncbi:SPBc2 prophage-derived transglycosylase [Paenibacillus sp. FSL R7-269]|uniref:hypothetical protein n=1 Tax=Paenibacillus sp. FSL R7-269 TaxID=1226755 RepID=UPI0003E24822|nr:hypothetical protein [Paenibacillus sp. FSL R7-269]ETT41433.1 SPBc2 prophage-derived transglycosylase [Paenibacillus sp. FSL R7-269]
MTAGGTNVGEIQARITLEMAEFRRQMDEARRRIRELEGDTRRGADGFRDMGSAIAGLAAGAGLSKLVNEMMRAVEAATKLHSAFAGLNAVAKGFGVQTKDAQAAVEELSSRGFLSLTESAQAFKTALSTGLSLEEAKNLINSLADSAAYGRQSFYTMGGAVQASLDGIKNGNSVLADAVGVTKNLSVMQKEYAATIGTTVGKLTDAQKTQAALNGFIREGIYYVGNADQAMQGIIGSQARFTQATNSATVAMGEAFTPVVQKALDTLTPLIIELADFTSANAELVSGLATGTAGVLAFIVALTSVSAALKLIPALFTAIKTAAAFLGLSTGPLGIALVAVGALATAFGALTAAKARDKAATEAMLSAQKELNELLAKASIDRTAADIETLKSKTEELAPLLEERARLQKQINEIESAQEAGTWMPEMFGQAMDVNEALGELDVKLEGLGYTGVEDATAKLAEMNAVVKRGTIALTEQDKSEAAAIATKKQTLVQMSALANEFKTLNAAQTLDAAQKNRLVDVTEKLIDQYPELNARQGEDGRIRADNIDVIISQINTDKRFTDMAAANVTARIRNFGKESEAQAKSVQAQITNLTKLSNALAIVSGAKATSFADDVAAREADRLRKTSGNVGDIVTNGLLTQAAAAGAKAEVDARVDAALKDQQKYANVAREMEKLANEVETGSQDFTKDIIAPDPEKGPKPKKEKKTKSAAELAAEARKAAYEADLKTVQFQADFYDMTADKQIAKYEELRKKHATFLKESVDDARTLTLQLKQLSEDSVQSRYDFSATWIDAEEKRMEDSGKTELKIAEMKLASWTRLRDRYAKDSEQYKAADDQRRQARKDVATATAAEARDQYEASAKWIDAEDRRMTDAGKSETEIAQMKLAAWTRVRDRYSKDSEYYAKADEQLYQTRKDITKQTVALADDLVKAQKDAIKEAKEADLDAIDQRKKAALDDYDARIDAIQKLRDANKDLNADADYETQLREKRTRLAELQSAVGPEGIAERDTLLKEIERMQLEHDREITDRTLETQQDALKSEKDAKGKAYDAEKAAAEAQYESLLKAFDAYSGDIKTVEDGIAAYRVSSANSANSAILTELDAFITQYNAKMATVKTAQAAAQKDVDLREYNANKTAWEAAKKAGNAAEMARLNARNEELRKLYGIDKDTGALQAFKDGGIVKGAVGSAVPIVAHAGEIVLNPQQQSALFDMVASPRVAAQAPAAPTYITNNIDMGAEEVVLTDKADIAMYYDEKTRAAQRLQAMGVKAL